jgi:hypothetical protein
VSTTPARRTGPLPLRVRDSELILSAGDTNRLIAGVGAYCDSLHESARTSQKPEVIAHAHGTIEQLHALVEELTKPCNPLSDPPLELKSDQLRLMRRVLADMNGYQRGDLTPALSELSRVISAD